MFKTGNWHYFKLFSVMHLSELTTKANVTYIVYITFAHWSKPQRISVLKVGLQGICMTKSKSTVLKIITKSANDPSRCLVPINIYVPDTSVFVSSYVWSGLGLVKVRWPILQWSPQTKCFATVFSEDLLWQVLLCALEYSGRGSRVASLFCKVILGTFISKFQRCFKPHLLFPRKVPNWKTIYKGKAEERELGDGKGYVGGKLGFKFASMETKTFFHGVIMIWLMKERKQGFSHGD